MKAQDAVGAFGHPKLGMLFFLLRVGWTSRAGEMLENEYGTEEQWTSWKMISLSKWMTFRFHVNFSGENEVLKC